MSRLPETIEFSRAFGIAFGLVVESGYSVLDQDDLSEEDRDDIRCQFDSALSETAYRFNLPDTAETLGELADIVLQHRTALNEYLIDTTQ